MLNYMGRPSWYLGGFITAWGLVSALTSQVKGYGSIVACRFILGLVGKLCPGSKPHLNLPSCTCTNPRINRGPLLRRRPVLPIEMVHEERTGVPHEYLLLGLPA